MKNEVDRAGPFFIRHSTFDIRHSISGAPAGASRSVAETRCPDPRPLPSPCATVSPLLSRGPEGSKSSMIKFGTSGWRGIIGEDFTFDKVRVATQGIANYLKSSGQK